MADERPASGKAVAADTITTFTVPPWVTHERLDDEVMAIDLETGAYYALDAVAADAWTLVAAGSSLDDAAAVLAARYDVGADTALVDLGALVDELRRERLLLPAEPGAGAPDATATLVPALAERLPYATPAVDKYDDLEELLRLDPVHDVDEVGWPVPRSD